MFFFFFFWTILPYIACTQDDRVCARMLPPCAAIRASHAGRRERMRAGTLRQASRARCGEPFFHLSSTVPDLSALVLAPYRRRTGRLLSPAVDAV